MYARKTVAVSAVAEQLEQIGMEKAQIEKILENLTGGENPVEYFERESHFIGDTFTAAEINELRELVRDGFIRIDLRIDHVYGKHDFARAENCPSCEVKYGSAA